MQYASQKRTSNSDTKLGANSVKTRKDDVIDVNIINFTSFMKLLKPIEDICSIPNLTGSLKPGEYSYAEGSTCMLVLE